MCDQREDARDAEYNRCVSSRAAGVKRALICLLSLTLFPIVMSGLALAQDDDCGCFEVQSSGPINCDSGDCEGEYQESFCTFGSLWSQCLTSGYGMCCETSFTAASATRCEGEHNGCEGQVRVRASRARPMPQDASRAVAGSGHRWFDGEEDILYVPNRCRQTYTGIYPGDQFGRKDSSASSEKAHVPAPGGMSP